MPTRSQPLGPGECNTDTGAKLIMCTPQWLNRLVKEGWIKKLGPDRFNVVDVVQGHIRYLKDETQKATITKSVSKVQEARAREIELKIAKEERSLIPIEDVAAWITEALSLFRSALTGVPAASTRDPETRIVIERNLDAVVGDLRTSLRSLGSIIAARQPIVMAGEEADA
jgi:hypothetical protein